MTKILVAAQESDVLETIPMTLTVAGHSVVASPCGLDAIKQARLLRPDLIILDSTLPDMDGETLRDILHRLPSTAAIPTLLLKPRAHPLMPAQLQRHSFHKCLTAPLDPGEVVRQVGAALAQSRELTRETELHEEMW